MAGALDAINSAINQYSTSNPWGSSSDTAVNSINQSAASGLTDTLNQLKQKINDSMNSYKTQEAAVPAQYQPDYNQHANDAAIALRNVQEAAANRGDNGGMAQENQLLVNSAKLNADAATDTNKYGALQKIKDAINQLDTDAQTQLGSYISDANKSRLSNISTQQAAEATAAEKAAEAQAANETKLAIANINAAKNSTGSTSTDVNSVVSDLTKNYVTKIPQYNSANVISGYSYSIDNPTGLLNNIDSMNVSDDVKKQIINAFPVKLSNGDTLAEYLDAVNNLYIPGGHHAE